MTKHEEFLVPVEIAKELNEIGFDKPCFFSFNEEVIGEIPLSFGKFLIKCNDHEAHLDGVIYGDKKVTDKLSNSNLRASICLVQEKRFIP